MYRKSVTEIMYVVIVSGVKKPKGGYFWGEKGCKGGGGVCLK